MLTGPPPKFHGTRDILASDGAFNLAGNLFGNANSVDGVPTPLIVFAGGDADTLGFGTVAANVFGNRNDVEAIGTLLNATAWGNVFRTPNGSDNIVTAGFVGSPTSLSWAFSYQGIFSQACSTALCGNDVNATGPLAIAGAIDVINQTVSQDGPGITIASQLDSTVSNTSVLAAGGSQGSLVRPSINASLNRPTATSPGGSILKSLSDRITTSANKFSTQGSLVRPSINASLNRPTATSPGGSFRKSLSDRITTSANKFSDTVSKVTNRLARGAKAGAASSDK